MKQKTIRVVLLCVFSMACIAAPVWAESGDTETIVTDESALFGEADDDSNDSPSSSGAENSEGKSGADLEESLFSESSDTSSTLVTVIESTQGIQTSLLTTAGVEIGGRYNFSVDSSWQWNDPATIIDDFTSPDFDSAKVNLGATLFFDARPTEDFRVFGKTVISYPFDTTTSDSASPGAEVREFEDVFHVEELFSDINWNEILFLRGGKHTINWGVGYFFSPADILNVTEIDPENPEADREGPVSIKAHLPFSAHNLYLYVIANNFENWDDIGIAPKLELVFGSVELGIGGLYQKDVAPSAMITASFPLWDVDIFGEAVIRYGSDKTFVEESDTSVFGVATVTRDEEFFYHTTAGVSFIYAFEEVDSSLNFVGQYLYNGEGYDDPSILSDNTAGIGALLGSGSLVVSDLINSGRHYAAVSGAWNGIFGSELSLRLFWIQNFSDMSGFVTPTLSYKIIDGVNLSLQVPYRYGDVGDEYTPTGDGLSARIAVSLGGGTF